MTEEKPFEATPRRVAKARREGNVARSGELAANVSFAAGAATVTAIVPVLAGASAASIHAFIAGASPGSSCALVIAVALLPIGAAAAAGALTTVVQNGGIHAGVTPRLERLDPLEGLKRIFSRETLAHSLPSCCSVRMRARRDRSDPVLDRRGDAARSRPVGRRGRGVDRGARSSGRRGGGRIRLSRSPSTARRATRGCVSCA